MHSHHWNTAARLRILLLALALLLAPLLGLTPTPALAAPSCATSGATVTCTFSYTGAPETWIVPAGVTQATFDLYGAAGTAGTPGRGGWVTATLAVTPGATYQVLVGGQNGFNGGGAGGVGDNKENNGGGGGGASDVRTGAFTLADRVLVAGGGGGAVGYPQGGNGGYPQGGNGGTGEGVGGGGGGSQTAGGAGGAGSGSGSSGSLGQGGNGGGGYFGGGGGGGGYFGGGGGAAANSSDGGGGGGGSSYATPAATGVSFQNGVRIGKGLVTISYDVPDATAPAASPSQSPAANANGWNNTGVTVSWNWIDNAGGVGIDSANCTTSSTDNGEGVQTLSAACADLAGNVGSASYSVKVDTTRPSISPAVTSSPNANGWYNGDVSVAFTCDDNLSGVVSCPANQLLTGEGASISSDAETIRDLAGNGATSDHVYVAIDRTAPVVSVTGVTNGASYTIGSVPSAGCSTTDALSGVATQAILSITGGNLNGTGSFTATCSGASDKAGNSGSASASYTVAYRWSGFFQPIDNLPTINSAKAGSAIPVKFSLGGNYGLNIFAAGYPKVQIVACASGAATDEVEQTVTAGASGLQYDAASGQYSYTWKTDKNWAGSCRQLVVKLVDGSEHIAGFQFK